MKINFFVMNVLALTSAATDLKSQTKKVTALSQTDTDLASSYPNWDQVYDPLDLAQRQKVQCPRQKIRQITKMLPTNLQWSMNAVESLREGGHTDQEYKDHVYDKDFYLIEA